MAHELCCGVVQYGNSAHWSRSPSPPRVYHRSRQSTAAVSNGSLVLQLQLVAHYSLDVFQ
jgi:hypothetical protein